MPKPIVGLHHVTAIASDPQRNLDFFTQVLGLRLVKRTINFDDPGTYHFYFGDDAGSPGTILTFFPWPRATSGTFGIGETAATSFRVPLSSISFWETRLLKAGISAQRIGTRFDEQGISFADPDGIKLEIVGYAEAHVDPKESLAPRTSNIPAEHSIRGFSGVTLSEGSFEQTAAILERMGFHKITETGNRYRFAADGHALGNHIDLLIQPDLRRGRLGAGSVHHIAFRAADDASQLEWRDVLIAASLEVTSVLDRTYFHSIYFREPGGVLFELATDPPGFTLDEPKESLGETLKLPPWLESQRSRLTAILPHIELHEERRSHDE